MGKVADFAAKYSKAAKPIVDAVPGVKWVGQKATNFFTGFRVTKPAAAIAVTGILASAVARPGLDAVSGGEFSKRETIKSGAVNVGPIPATQFEGTGTGARSNLGATGDLVFGLHNARRG
jgi:hypothetical protein